MSVKSSGEQKGGKRTRQKRAAAAGARSATLADVARNVGVSAVTVSNVLNGKRQTSPHRQAILRAVEQLDFRPNPHARRLSQGCCNDTIDLFLGALDFGVATLKIRLLQETLTQRNFSVPIHICGLHTDGPTEERIRQQARLMSELRRQRPRAIICDSNALYPDTLQELMAYQAEGGIAICYDRSIPAGCDSVVFDREHNTWQAARHLLELGHRDIGFFPGGPGPDPRVDGFRRALAEYGGRCRPEWFLAEPDEPACDPHNEYHRGVQFAHRFLQLRERPTAMCIADDLRSAVFIQTLSENGVKVPADLSVVSQDDLKVFSTTCQVPLSTVSQPIELIVENVIRLLTSRLNNEYNGPPRSIAVQGELIVRQSAIPRTPAHAA